jgi:hypothetical protein
MDIGPVGVRNVYRDSSLPDGRSRLQHVVDWGPGTSAVNELSIQPIFNYHFGEGWYAGWGDQPIEVDWEKGNAVYAPLSFRLGKVFAIARQHVNSNIQFIYNVGDDIPGKDQWGLKFTVTLLFPE